MKFAAEYKGFFLTNIINSLYSQDRYDIRKTITDINEKAIKSLGYTKGFFLVYYDGEWYDSTIDKDRSNYCDPIRIDLPPAFHAKLNACLNDSKDLEDEIHNVEGLLRSVLNASTSHDDIHVLMPRQIRRKCPYAFQHYSNKPTLTKTEIKAFEDKHEKMLSGLKQKVLRDLLLKKR